MGNQSCCGHNNEEKELRGFKAMGRLNEYGEAKIVIIGLDNSGKTAIFDKLTGKERELNPTKGFNTEKIEYENGFKIDLWELGGAREVRPYWKNYFKNIDGIIFVVDSTDSKRFDEAALAFKKVLEDKRLIAVPIQILANKQDHERACNPIDLEGIFNLHEINDRIWMVDGCSVYSG